VGTTGWDQHQDEIRQIVEQADGGLVHAANFSLGVQLFYSIVRNAASLMARFAEYDPYVLERHHRRKRDAPSGTARVLASFIESEGHARTRATTELVDGLPDDAFHVVALRAGGIVGDHTVGFDSGGDEILLEHRARTRRGFALGSVMAAEWIATRSGFHSFEYVVEDLLRG
jgi:4-hydroxy-tetrahydrodipicolinate reductase